MSTRRPSIFQVGRVVEDGATVRITGWGLGLCMAGCSCHMNPQTHHLDIDQDFEKGRVGLHSYPRGGGTCFCCEPWGWRELKGFLACISSLAKLPTRKPPVPPAVTDKPTPTTEKEGPA